MMIDKIQKKVPVDKYLNYKKEFDNNPYCEAIPINKDGNYMPIGKTSDENLRKVADSIYRRLAP